jgi:hypothetical protein
MEFSRDKYALRGWLDRQSVVHVPLSLTHDRILDWEALEKRASGSAIPALEPT